jgi:protein O-GlcNAc transferase
MPTIADLLHQALRQHQGGDLLLAENLYRQVLQADARNADAWHLLGLIAGQVGRFDVAVEHIVQALRLRPNFAVAHSNLGNVLRDLGRLTEAEACCRQALRLQPGFADAHINLGNVLRELGQLEEAEVCYRQALRIQPNSTLAHCNLGDVCRARGRLEAAESCYRQALHIQPDHARAWNNLGVALQERGLLGEAESCLREAIRLKPDYAEAHNNLANLLCGQRRLEEAETCCRRALRLRPDFAEAQTNLGVVLQEQARPEEAEACYRQALDLKPENAETHNNLGTALRAQGKLEEAEAGIREALRLKPAYTEAHFNLGNVLRDQGRLELGAACYRQALNLNPDMAEAHNNLGVLCREQGKPEEAEACYRQALRIKPGYAEAHNNIGNLYKDDGQLDAALAAYRQALHCQPDFAAAHSNLLYTLLFSPDYDAQTVFEEHQRWNRQYAEPLARNVGPHTNDRSADRRLKIGYVSSDFKSHPVGRYVVPLLQAHDHSRIDVHCYSGVKHPDAVTALCRACADVWRDVRYASDVQLADLIRQDRIDILVDLTMHMANHRLLVFARKPAPVQAIYLAYAGTTGLTAIDYRLTDNYLDPPGQDDPFCTERAMRLPDSWWCYHPVLETPEANALPALKKGYVTFGCLNNFCKVVGPTLEAWRVLLQKVPESRLLMFAPPGPGRRRVRDYFATGGVAPDRVHFVDWMATADYFWKFHDIDIALDPFPYGGGTTTCDALWMGVPVVTLAGPRKVSRGGLSLLSTVRLQEWVAYDVDGYARIAMDLAGDLARLSTIRAGLRDRMRASPLMDAPRFAKNMEAAYETMWRRWCAQAHSDRAIALHAQGRLAEAEDGWRATLRLQPDYLEAQSNLGVVLQELGRLPEAEAHLCEALRLNPNYAVAHYNLGNVLRDQGKLTEAVAGFRQALRLDEAHVEAHNNLGHILREQGELEEAEVCLREALRRKPGFASAQVNLGNVFRDQGKPEKAEACLRAALRLAPDCVEAHSYLGAVLQEQGRAEEAEACCRRALRLRPDFAEAHVNLGNIHHDRRELAQAEACYREALRFKPEYAYGHYNLSLLSLLQGDFTQGWSEYEWRRQVKELRHVPPAPTWDGGALGGRTILLQAEQGFGDTLQFVRYAAPVKAKGGRVLLECPSPLAGILAGCPGIDLLVAAGTSQPEHDVAAPLMSLPLLCGTTGATIPCDVPYLAAEPARVAHFRTRLDAIPGFKVGVCWQGNPKHKNDRRRSVALANFAPVAAVLGVTLVSLQRGTGLEQRTRQGENLRIVELLGRFQDPAQDWSETAALIEAVDLVLSVDTGVVHLAGAMGAPVWVVLPFMPDWRWLMGREDSPWYPTVRLFRQTEPGNWAQVFERIAMELRRERSGR